MGRHTATDRSPAAPDVGSSSAELVSGPPSGEVGNPPPGNLDDGHPSGKVDSASTEASAAEAAETTGWTRAAVIVGGVGLLVALILTAFAYPATHVAPRDLPLGVVGPRDAVSQISSGLQQNAGADGFEITTYDSLDAATAAVQDREAYGAVVLGPDGGRMLTAPAGSPAVAQILTQLAAGIPEQAGGPLEVTEVAPLPDGDARGAAIPSAMLPILVGGLASAALSFFLMRGSARQVSVVVGAAVVAGTAIILVLQTWLDALGGSFVANAGGLALGLGAIALTVLGLSRLLGTAGIGVGALLMMFVGNPLSGAASAPELLPAGWGLLGQLLPPGATSQLLRSTAFFDGAGAVGPVVVLTGWVLLGLALVALGHRRAR